MRRRHYDSETVFVEGVVPACIYEKEFIPQSEAGQTIRE